MSIGDLHDLLVIGGGINGAGIARDAAGRGLRVALCERGDLGGATSWASSKLVHGGLRYLEHGELRLVREALAEREVLLRVAPHLVRPLRFVLPHAAGMRPRWMIRLGLWLYDRLGGESTLPRSRAVELWPGLGLKPAYAHGFEYSDCWVDDARLVIANARSAAQLGARILVRTRCSRARGESGVWRARLALPDGQEIEVRARAIVNAAGPWAERVLRDGLGIASRARLRLVQGSHIVVKRTPPERALILQQKDRRVVFVLPFEAAHTLIGTTDVPVSEPSETPQASQQEIDYLLAAVNRYVSLPIAPAEVQWTYAGLRALYDDGAQEPSEITRDYVLQLDQVQDLPCLSVFGGKVTTYRTLAEEALGKLGPWLASSRGPWTARAALPGSDLPAGGLPALMQSLEREYPGVPDAWVRDLASRHGTLARDVLGDAQNADRLGLHFGAGLTQREVDYFVDQEWARTADDVLWRRTKCGLRMSADERDAIALYVAARCKERAALSPFLS